MSMIRTPHALPPLAPHAAEFLRLAQTRTQTAALLDLLRRIARDARRGDRQRFYPARAVGDAFRVPLPTVLRVFAELEKEGILLRVRGSGTLLQPRQAKPSASVRGVVGLPLWQYGYCNLTDWRLFVAALSDALRQRGYVADLIFFQSGEQPRLLDQLMAHHLDWIVWFKPRQEHGMIVQMLADRGVHTAIVMQRYVNLSLPAYHLRFENAIRRAFAAWRRDGIRSVVVAQPWPLDPDSEWPSWLRWRLKEAHMDCHFEFLPDWQHFPTLCAHLTRRATSGIWLPDDWFGGFASEDHARRMANLLQRKRVLIGGRLEMPAVYLSGCRIDATVQDWPAITSRIADDITTGRLLKHRDPVAIDARLDLRADATRFAQLL